MAGEYAKVNPSVEQVYFRPNAERVNAQINYLNGVMDGMPPAEAAELMASSIASMAYMILETNGVEETKDLFASLIDEAYAQRMKTAVSKGH